MTTEERVDDPKFWSNILDWVSEDVSENVDVDSAEEDSQKRKFNRT